MRLNNLSKRAAGLLVALSVVLLAPSDCNIDVGNLGDFIVTHEITVTNSASDDALVWIAGPGLKRRSLLKPGGQVSATLYSGKEILISVAPGVDVLAELKAKRAELSAQLSKQPFTLVDSMGVYSALNLLNSQIKEYEARGHGQLCVAELKVDDKGKGNNVTAVATLEGDTFRVAC